MSYRRLVVCWILVAVVSLAPTPAASQEAPRSASGAATGIGGLLAPADSTTLPRTPWGHPDLQGVWNNSTSTPLERRTEAEKERGQLAQEAVIEATRGTGAGWIERASGLDRESLVIDPPDGRIPELLPAAKQRLIDRENGRTGHGEGDSWLDRNTWERCITRTMPVTMIPNAYNANYQILQTPDHVVILIEMIHESRVIPLDGRPHVSDGVRQWLGDSRGRWEGDTLVVETERFNNRMDGGDYQPSARHSDWTPWPRRYHAIGRAVQNGRRQHDRLSVHARGSEDVYAVLHSGHSLDTARHDQPAESPVRVCVSRGEPRDGEPAQGSPHR